MTNQVVTAGESAQGKPIIALLRNRLYLYEQLLHSSLDVICSIDREGRFITVSAAAADLWGYTPEELEGVPYLDLVVPEDKELTIRAAADIMSGIDMTNFENRYTCKNGAVKPILWSAAWDAQQEIMYCVAKDATQIKLAETRLRRAYKLAGLAWWEYDVATQTYTSSDEIFEMYGVCKPEDNKTSLDDFISLVHPEDRCKLINDLSKLDVDSYFRYEHRLIKPSGELIYLVHFSEVIRDKDGNAVSLHGSAMDITASKLNQIRLEESERSFQQYSGRLTSILESLGDGFYTLDHNWTVTYWNNKAEELTGRNRKTLLGKNLWKEFNVALLQQRYFSEFQQAIKENKPVHFEEFDLALNSWFEISAYPSKEGLSVFFKNISERKLQEKELQISNERFRFVSKATTDVIWDWNLENGELYVNQSFTRIFGHDLKSGISPSNIWEQNLHPEDKCRILQSQQHAIDQASETHWEGSYRLLKADGEVAYVKDRAFIVRDNTGKAIRMIGAVQDITEQRKQEQRVEFVAKATSEVIWERAWNSEEVDINHEKLEQLFGYRINGKRIHRSFWYDKVHPDDTAQMRANREEALEKGRDHYDQEYRFKRADGSWAFVKDRTFIIKNDEGQPISLIGAMEDVTEKKKLQEQLVHEKINQHRNITKATIEAQEQERSEIGKELHDNVSQLLATANLYLRSIKTNPEQTPCFLDKGANLVQKAIEEIRKLSRVLVTPTFHEVPFKDTLIELMSAYIELNLFAVDYCFDFDEQRLDKGMRLTIYRIVQELFNNAVKYAKASCLSLKISCTHNILQLNYCDNGVGFDMATVKRGLGLNNIKHRAETYMGTVLLHSAPGKGCVMQINFTLDAPHPK